MDKIVKKENKIVIVFPGLQSTKAVDCGSMIIQHKTWSYDDNHKLIVVDGEKEDRQKIINENAKTTGLKNILKGMIESRDVAGIRSLALTPEQCGDTTIEANLNIDSIRKQVHSDEQLAKASATFGMTSDEMLHVDKKTLDQIIEKKVAELTALKAVNKEVKKDE